MKSTSSENKSYVTELDRIENLERLSLPEDDWIQFLLDHRAQIIENSQLVQLDPETMYRYRYRIRDYLKEKHNDTAGLDQIFRIINRLYNDLDFNLTLTHAYVPDAVYCLDLKKKFNTAKAKRNKI